MILPLGADDGAVLETVTRLREHAVRPIRLGGRSLRVTVSVGLARVPEDAADAERIDLVLVEMSPIDVGLVNVLARVRQRHPLTRSIAVGSTDDGRAVADAVNRGGLQAFLPQPWDAKLLIAMIREVLGGPARREPRDG